MKKGSLSERYLENAVIKNMKKINNSVKVGADYAVAKLETSDVLNDDLTVAKLVTSDGASNDPTVAFAKAMNNYLCSGARPEYARITLFFPVNSKESHIKRYTSELDRLATESNINIIGGHTEVSDCFVKPFVTVTLLGTPSECEHDKKKVYAGCDIVMAGYAGILGSNMLLDGCYDELKGRINEAYLEAARYDCKSYRVDRICEMADGWETFYMHDVSHGGVYTALWQLGKWLGKGIFIEGKNIPIKQETIEICETLDCNPYLIDGTGALLIVCKDGRGLVKRLMDNNIAASVIGRVTDDKERLVRINDTDIRTLSPSDGDDAVGRIGNR